MRRVLSVAVVAAIASLIVVPAAAGWVWPADGPVLRPFSLAEDHYAVGQHRGIDIGAAAGGAVRAPAAGVVSFTGPVPAGGRALTIQTADGYAVTLLQLGAISVARGGTVAEGEIVGEVGASEDAVTQAPHVHLGIRVASEPNGYVDPIGLLPVRPPLAAPEPAPAASPEPAPPAVVVPEQPVAEVAPVVTPAPAEAAVADPVAVEPTRSATVPARAASAPVRMPNVQSVPALSAPVR
jgi:murein DD-endopeptidase MepM/ murein hydrolase activator NlpD